MEVRTLVRPKKRKCLVTGYPTDPNILGPTQTFLKPFGILILFLDLFKRFLDFFYTKMYVRNENLIFLFLNQNISCGYSKEPSQ